MIHIFTKLDIKPIKLLVSHKLICYSFEMLNLRSRVVKPAVNAARLFQRNSSTFESIGSTLQRNVWQKSTTAYITYILVGCVFAEAVYGTVTNGIWESANKGVCNSVI